MTPAAKGIVNMFRMVEGGEIVIFVCSRWKRQKKIDYLPESTKFIFVTNCQFNREHEVSESNFLIKITEIL